jgi:hypothetical protein
VVCDCVGDGARQVQVFRLSPFTCAQPVHLSLTRESVCEDQDQDQDGARKSKGRRLSSQGRQALQKVVQERRVKKSGHFAVDMRHACILETPDANGRREGNWKTGTALPGASHQVDLSNLVMHAGYIWDRFEADRGCST